MGRGDPLSPSTTFLVVSESRFYRESPDELTDPALDGTITPANVARWILHGPSSRIAALCAGVGYPECRSKPYPGYLTASFFMSLSRQTLASMDAAEI